MGARFVSVFTVIPKQVLKGLEATQRVFDDQ